MSAESRVAVRYADALITLAQEQGTLERIKQDMEMIKATIKDSRDLKLFLRNPVAPLDKKAGVLNALFADKVDKVVTNFLKLVADKGRADVMEDIVDAVIAKYEKIKGIQTATVKTAFPIDEELRAAFTAKVKQISGKDSVELNEVIDKSLIGGYVLNVNDRQIDTSVASQLKQLKQSFAE
ncbi:ATP synthase F1 subunit delta [Limibacter armeniacum]|uniref:ATP synthase F1 subunit delta n=1 Tax=Limibacter armeniacum TaxID=466084 RepID=UPI002FE62189